MRIVRGLATLVIAISLASVGLEALGAFRTSRALAAGLFLAVVLWQWLPRGDSPKLPRRLWLLVPIVLLHLAFRLPTYPHVEGGQDQGLYYGLGVVFEREGQDLITDRLGASLTGDRLEFYQQGGGFSMPGIYPASAQSHASRIELYPLHPLWLAITGAVLDPESRNLAVTAFSLVGLLAACGLAFELSGRIRAGLLSAALIATNPGLAFLAKTSHSETVAFAFAANSAYFLARSSALRSFEEHRRPSNRFDLGLAVGCFACLCLSRPTGVAFLPILTLGVASLAVNRPNAGAAQQQRRTFLAVISMAVLVPLSVFYYRHSMPTVAAAQLGVRDGRDLYLFVAAIAVSVSLIWTLYRMAGNSPVERLQSFGARHRIALLQLAAVGFLVWQIYSFVQLQNRPELQWLGYPRLSGLGDLSRTPLARAIVHLGPFATAIILYTLIRPANRLDGARLWLAGVVVSLVPAMFLMGYRYSPYSFYYDRYVLEQIVPFALVLTAILITDGVSRGRSSWCRRVHAVALLGILALFLITSTAQLGKIEGPDRELFAEIDALVDANTLLVMESSSIPHHQAVITGLRLELDLDVMPVATIDSISTTKLLGRRHRAFLLSGRPLQPRDGLSLRLESQHQRSFFRDRSPHMSGLLVANHEQVERVEREWTPDWMELLLPPVDHVQLRFPVYVYELTRTQVPAEISWRFEAEQLETTASSSRTIDLERPATSGGMVRRLGPSDAALAQIPLAATYGPYIELQPGLYSIEFRIRVEGDRGASFRLDATSGRGQKVHAVSLLDGADLTGEWYRSVILDLELDEKVDDFETRVWYLGGGTIWIDYIEIRRRTASDPSPRPESSP